MPSLKFPALIDLPIEGHRKWITILQEAEQLVEGDADFQYKVSKGLRLKGRNLAPEVLGRMYAQYCDLINRMYDTYLNNVQLQRAPYILDIINVFIKRIYELRNELVHVIVNDYIYVDGALTQLRMTPDDIQIVVPYHFPLDARPNSLEELFQRMTTESIRRKNKPPKKPKPPPSDIQSSLFDEDAETAAKSQTGFKTEEEETEDIVPVESVHTIIPEEYSNAVLIQRHERFRQFFLDDYKARCAKRKTYFAANITPAPKNVRKKAATMIIRVYREYMRLKRQQVSDVKRDIVLGLIPDVDRRPLSFTEENNKLYEFRRKARQKLQEPYLKDYDRQNFRMIVINKENQIDDITEDILQWFREWYYDYGYFPQYPYVDEGGTVLVITGEYPTVDEQIEDDERYKKKMKGKTKEMLEKEKQQAKLEAEMKAELAKEQAKKEVEGLFKARCNPLTDPGYQPMTSEATDPMREALRKYQQAWSIYDQLPLKECKEIIYGYMMPLINEEIMRDMHLECRKYVDELMRLELKVFVKAQKAMFKRVNWNYPKLRTRKRPKPVKIPKPFVVDERVLENIEKVFDLGIMSRPKVKISDVIGDLSYAAYDMNIIDPEAKFPPPGYGDVRRRLVLSCVCGSGMEPSAKRNKGVLLLGVPRNGKSFIVDTIAGEMNAVKFDISPEVFSAVAKKPARLLTYVFLAARVFQPAVIYLRDVERVFCKKVPQQEKHLKSKTLKKPLGKMLKALSSTDKVIFIATCSNPFVAQQRPMLNLFNEVILVPRPDYASVQQFFYYKLQGIRSMPRDYCVHSLARLLEGFGFGVIMELFNTILTPERIIRLNITPLNPAEFLECLIEHDMQKLTPLEYQKYIDFFVNTSYLKREREEYKVINETRKYVYDKLAKIQADKEAKAAKRDGKG